MIHTSCFSFPPVPLVPLLLSYFALKNSMAYSFCRCYVVPDSECKQKRELKVFQQCFLFRIQMELIQKFPMIVLSYSQEFTCISFSFCLAKSDVYV